MLISVSSFFLLFIYFSFCQSLFSGRLPNFPSFPFFLFIFFFQFFRFLFFYVSLVSKFPTIPQFSIFFFTFLFILFLFFSFFSFNIRDQEVLHIFIFPYYSLSISSAVYPSVCHLISTHFTYFFLNFSSRKFLVCIVISRFIFFNYVSIPLSIYLSFFNFHRLQETLNFPSLFFISSILDVFFIYFFIFFNCLSVPLSSYLFFFFSTFIHSRSTKFSSFFKFIFHSYISCLRLFYFSIHLYS